MWCNEWRVPQAGHVVAQTRLIQAQQESGRLSIGNVVVVDMI